MASKKQTGPRIGRPPGTFTSDRRAIVPAVRCTQEQRETFDALGGAEWLRSVLDREARKLAKG